MSDDDSKAARWFAELKRRKVFRVAAAYLVGAWLLVQVAGTTFEPMGLPPWTLKLVITLAAFGFPLACAYSTLGDSDDALDMLDRAVQQGRGNLEWIEHDPDFDNLRSDSRFDAIVNRIRASRGAPPA